MECTVLRAGAALEGLVYLPHPESKPMHHQPTTVVELLLPRLPDLSVGEELEVGITPGQATFAPA